MDFRAPSLSSFNIYFKNELKEKYTYNFQINYELFCI